MLVAVSGTPGTGKTAVTTLLQKKGYEIINLNTIALKHGFISGIDKKRDSKILDINKINKYVRKQFCENNLVFIEGHASHFLSAAEKLILLRCHPQTLKKRLQKRKWNDEKITENIEAEALDIILCESVEYFPEKNIFEIDTTNKTIESVAASIETITKSGFMPIKKYNIGKIDWSEEIGKDR